MISMCVRTRPEILRFIYNRVKFRNVRITIDDKFSYFFTSKVTTPRLPRFDKKCSEWYLSEFIGSMVFEQDRRFYDLLIKVLNLETFVLRLMINLVIFLLRITPRLPRFDGMCSECHSSEFTGPMCARTTLKVPRLSAIVLNFETPKYEIDKFIYLVYTVKVHQLRDRNIIQH